MKDHAVSPRYATYVAHSELSHQGETSLDRTVRIAIECHVPFTVDHSANRIVLYDPTTDNINHLIQRGLIVQRKVDDFRLEPCQIIID